jgi:hypothetical protein
MKKLLPLLIVGIFVFSGLGTSAYTDNNILNNLQFQRNCENNIIKDEDELDQYQLEMDGWGPIGREPDSPYYIVAQGFTPTKNILTRVELMVMKNVATTYDLTLAIRDILTGPDLTSISKNPASIPTNIFSWIEFDFDNIKVTPGKTYFIVCSTVDAFENWYAWGGKTYNPYPNGTILWSHDGQEWSYDLGIDTTFKTYGRDNNRPDLPEIIGETNGKIQTSYEYTVSSIDPDGDDIAYYLILWDDDTHTNKTGPFASGESVTASHKWTKQGTYKILVRATDVFGKHSPWGTLDVTMPRNRAMTNLLLLRFLEQFPILQKILLLQRLKGLQ